MPVDPKRIVMSRFSGQGRVRTFEASGGTSVAEGGAGVAQARLDQFAMKRFFKV